DHGTCVPTPPTSLPPPDAGVDGGLAYYDVRWPSVDIPADGYSRIPVLALGRRADGQPALDAVLLYTSRANAGTLAPSALTLTDGAASSYFTPCLSSAAGCLGPLQITMALASAPNVAIASSIQVNLVTPTGVGTPVACLTGGNVVFFDGETGD